MNPFYWANVAAPVRHPPATARALGFTAEEWQALQSLRARYQAHGDWLGRQDLERLRFVRWLVLTGRLKS